MKNKKLYIVIFSVILLISSCTSIKYIYNENKQANFTKISLALKNADYISNEEFYLVFTKGFNNKNIKIIENGNQIFDDIIETKSNNVAKTFKLKYDNNYQIELMDLNEKIIIIPEKVKNYKFIYISKIRNKFIINFNNGEKIK